MEWGYFIAMLDDQRVLFFLLQLNCSNGFCSQRGLVLLLPLAIGWDCLMITSQRHGESGSTHSGIAGHTNTIIPTPLTTFFFWGDRSTPPLIHDMNLIMPPEIINEARYAFELFENAQLFRQCACNEWMYVGGDVKNSYLRRVWFCEYWWSMNLPTYYIPAYQGAYRFVCTHTQTFKVTIQWCIQQYTYVYIYIDLYEDAFCICIYMYTGHRPACMSGITPANPNSPSKKLGSTGGP